MIAAHLPHIPQIPERDVLRVLPVRGFFTMHSIYTALIENPVRNSFACRSRDGHSNHMNRSLLVRQAGQ